MRMIPKVTLVALVVSLLSTGCGIRYPDGETAVPSVSTSASAGELLIGLHPVNVRVSKYEYADSVSPDQLAKMEELLRKTIEGMGSRTADRRPARVLNVEVITFRPITEAAAKSALADDGNEQDGRGQHLLGGHDPILALLYLPLAILKTTAEGNAEGRRAYTMITEASVIEQDRVISKIRVVGRASPDTDAERARSLLTDATVRKIASLITIAQ